MYMYMYILIPLYSIHDIVYVFQYDCSPAVLYICEYCSEYVGTCTCTLKILEHLSYM